MIPIGKNLDARNYKSNSKEDANSANTFQVETLILQKVPFNLKTIEKINYLLEIEKDIKMITLRFCNFDEILSFGLTDEMNSILKKMKSGKYTVQTPENISFVKEAFRVLEEIRKETVPKIPNISNPHCRYFRNIINWFWE